MCWIGRKDTKQIAKRDFYVYKIGVVLGNTFVSLFQKHIYRIKGSNLIDPKQKHAIWIAIRAIDTCTENGFIVED